jgi:amidase
MTAEEKVGSSTNIKVHFLKATKETLNCYLDSSISPVLVVNPDEYVDIETKDCYGGLVTPSSPHPDNVPRSQLNPVTGPIYVNGSEPGDWLAVTFHGMRPDSTIENPGVACCGPHSGQLSHRVSTTTTRFFDVSYDSNEDRTDIDKYKYNDPGSNENYCTVINGRVTMREEEQRSQQPQQERRRTSSISFPLRPMLGVVAVAPASGRVSTMPAGAHGGNLDNKMNGIGSTVYLPISHKGGLLSVGDMHASMGDGEISGTGVEVGGRVVLSCRVLKQKDLFTAPPLPSCDRVHVGKLEFPVTETATHWMTHGVTVENIPEATSVACDEAAKLLVGQWGFTYEEAFIFLSVRGDLGLCQSCHPDQGTQIARMMVEKLEMCPRPFRCLLKCDDESGLR